MWRIIILIALGLLAVACGPAAVAPADDAPQPEQIEAVAFAAAALADQLNLDVEEIQVVKVEDAEWSDSCLGLGGPAESCLLAVTPGFKVTLEAEGVEYVYRTDETGSQVRLELTTE